MKTWFSIRAQAKDSAVIDILDGIGEGGITAKDFIRDLRALGQVKEIQININSYGGSVWEGLTIYNALREHGATITVKVYGIAASIASAIAMAGDKIIMPANTFLFVHNAWGIVVGNHRDMETMRKALVDIDGSLGGIYAKKSGKSESDARGWMDADSWFSASAAKDAGLCTEVTDALDFAVAEASMKRFKNIPAALRNHIRAVASLPNNTATLKHGRPNPSTLNPFTIQQIYALRNRR